MIITGQVGSGISLLIGSLSQILGDLFTVCCYSGTAAFDILGQNLRNILKLPVRGEIFNKIKVDSLIQNFFGK